MKHTNLILTFLLFIFLSTSVFAQVTQEWVRTYNGPVNQEDVGVSVAVDDYGNVYVTGRSYGVGTGRDYATIKYNSSGVQQWIQRYNGPGYSDDQPYSIALDDSGNAYVTGGSHGSGTGWDYATVKYNSAGVQQWVQRYAGTGNSFDYAFSTKVDDSGNVYITGESNFDIVTIKYNSVGVVQWIKTYNGPANLGDRAWYMTLDADGNVYVAGDTGFNPLGDYSNYVTLKYNSGGIQQWAAIYDGPFRDDGGNSVAVDSSKNVYVTGWSSGPGNSRICITIKYNSSGVQQWLQIYSGNGEDIGVDNSGNVYVTGWYWQNYRDIATVKYSASGVQQWIKTYNGPGNGDDIANRLTLDDSGNVYVAGYSSGSGTSSDYTSIKYNSSGVQQWVLRFNGVGNGGDCANSIAMDGSSNVYVTGNCMGSGTDYDYGTIKYSQTPIPAAPVLISPSNNSVGQGINLLFIWSSVEYANKYRFQLSTDNSFTNILLDDSTLTDTMKIVTNLSPLTDYYWRVNARNTSGTSPWSTIFHFTTGVTNITLNNEIPTEFRLYNSYPNPFNPSTKIKFDIPKFSLVKLIVYDVLGREIKMLVNEKLNAGRYAFDWDGSGYPSGVYIYKLVAGDFVDVKKMILLK